jgi:hypothetical protein
MKFSEIHIIQIIQMKFSEIEIQNELMGTASTSIVPPRDNKKNSPAKRDREREGRIPKSLRDRARGHPAR